MSEKKIKVVLIVGGSSGEREVSKESGANIYNALIKLNYDVKIIDPAYGKNQPAEAVDYFSKNDFAELSNENYIEALNLPVLNDADVAFIALHGKWGEDGTIQSLLELKGIKYTGSDVLASSLGMNKSISKIMFNHFDVRTPKWFIVDKTSTDINLIKEKIEKFFGYPCVIKPNDEGSTLGLTICKNQDEVEKGINFSFEYSNVAMVEEYIPGRELTVSVIDKVPMPVLEIKPKHGFYDYEAKYTDGMSEYEVPANLPEDIALQLQQQALLAYQAIGCKDYSRIDFRFNDKNEFYCLEVNTLPGMTSHSLVPKAAKAVGISFEELIDRITKSALK